MGRLRASAIRVSLDTERNRSVPPEINQKTDMGMLYFNLGALHHVGPQLITAAEAIKAASRR
jgi:hypothetical protein